MSFIETIKYTSNINYRFYSITNRYDVNNTYNE